LLQDEGVDVTDKQRAEIDEKLSRRRPRVMHVVSSTTTSCTGRSTS
jgi:hypothetical protein